MDFVIVIVGVPLPEVQASLNAMGVLMSTDLVDIHADMATPEDRISTQSEPPYFLLIPHDSAEALMARFIQALTQTHPDPMEPICGASRGRFALTG